nr:MAG TPA: hypothetical protein [Caudoviricetes sp.]
MNKNYFNKLSYILRSLILDMYIFLFVLYVFCL